MRTALESVAVTTLEQSPGIDAEYRLLREEAGRLPRPELRLIEVTGAEGAEFLQGQLTNDIEALEPGQGCYAALLDRKGKMRSDMVVLRRAADDILLILPELAAAEVERHLQMYKIGRDADVEARDDLAVLSVIGPRTPEALGGVPLGAEHSHREVRLDGRDVLAATSAGGADLIASDGRPRAPSPPRSRPTASTTVSAEAAAIVRVETGRPAFGAEMGNETMPQEAGINERAVNFEKGCYVGQETVARLHYKGKPNRHLRRLRSAQPLEAGAEVRLGERELGTLGTVVLTPAGDWQALAILRREAEPGAEVEVGEATATVEAVEEDRALEPAAAVRRPRREADRRRLAAVRRRHRDRAPRARSRARPAAPASTRTTTRSRRRRRRSAAAATWRRSRRSSTPRRCASCCRRPSSTATSTTGAAPSASSPRSTRCSTSTTATGSGSRPRASRTSPPTAARCSSATTPAPCPRTGR